MNNHRRSQISNKRDYVLQCLYKVEVILRNLSLRREYRSTKHILTRTDYKPKHYLIF